MIERPDDIVETREITAESAGWVRVHNQPRTWERPDGSLYIFSPGSSEVLVAPTESLPEMMRRIAQERGLP